MNQLESLCKAPVSKRDAQWEKELFEAFKSSPFYLVEDQPFQGPDGFSYMHISSSEASEVVKDDFLQWCFESGVGLVLNLKDKKAPDFVFNYGMLWNYLLRGSFVNKIPEKTKDSNETFVHELSEGFLPKTVRSNIDDFLKMNGVEKSLVTLTSGGDKTPYELLWHFPKLQEIEEKDQMALLEAIAWFLPLDYRIAWADTAEEALLFKDL